MTAAVGHRARALVANSFLTAGGSLLALLAAEAVLRVFYQPPSPVMDMPRLTRGSSYKADPELGWIPRENAQGVHHKKGSFTSSFRTNSRGLRGGERDIPKPAGWRRIVALGDSFTWGYGVGDDEIYTSKLEATLSKTEVINLGVTAYGLTQEIGYYKREGSRYAPDVVLLGFCLNDIYRASPQVRPRREVAGDAVPAAAPRDAAPAMGTLLAVKRYVSSESVLYQLALSQINRSKWLVKTLVHLGLKEPLAGFGELDTNLMPALRDYPPALLESWERTKIELLQLKALGREQGFRLVIAIVPSIQSVQPRAFEDSIAYMVFEPDDFDLDKPYRLIEEFARANGIDAVNPVNLFRGEQQRGRNLYLANDMHFNGDGHELFAQAIAAYLMQSLRW